MQKLRQATVAPRFTSQDLQGWTAKALRALSVSSHLLQSSQDIQQFRSKKKIEKELSPSERMIVTECITTLAEQQISSVNDVHGHYLQLSQCHYARDGLRVQEVQKTGSPKQIVVPAALWVAPVALITNYPGLHWVVGMAITCLKRAEGKIERFFEDLPYQKLAFTSLNASQLMGFADTLVFFIGKWFEGKKHTGNGRAFIGELFQAIGSLSKEDYVALHLAVAEGPLNKCFEWSEKVHVSNGSKLEVKYRQVKSKQTDSKEYFLRGVKKPMLNAFRMWRPHQWGKKCFEMIYEEPSSQYG